MTPNNRIIENSDPLKPNYIPGDFVNREHEADRIQAFLDSAKDRTGNVLTITGPRGTGKTHLVLKHLHRLSNAIGSFYVPCYRFDTQYKILKQILRNVLGKNIDRGFHTATLQRKLQKRTNLKLVLVLDDLEFLLQNDGDSLLYYLSRLNQPIIHLICITSNPETIKSGLEERTFSSLQPQKLHFEPYNSNEIFNILADRARLGLKPKTVHRQALRLISEEVEDVKKGILWLRTAAEETNNRIAPGVVEDVREDVQRRFIEEALEDFSFHHELLHVAIQELSRKSKPPIRTGEIYRKYREICTLYEEDALSDRRASTYLKHFELMDLIKAEYHYGGRKGKTREIHPSKPL